MSDFLGYVMELLLDLFVRFRWWRCFLAVIASLVPILLFQWLLPEGRTALWLSVASGILGLAIGTIWEWRADDRHPYWR